MGMFRAFTHRAFLLLWASALAIQLGQWFVTITFQWVLPHSSDRDAILLGLLYFCTFTPYLLFSLPAGALADSRDRRRILVGSQVAAIAFAALCTVLAAVGALPPQVVLVLGFVCGTISVTVSPANQALTANTVPLADLTGAISLQSMALNLARIAGPMLAGPLLLIGGATGAFGVYTVISTLALVLLLRMRTPRLPARRTAESVIDRVRAGIRHARDRHPALPTLAAVAVTAVFGCGYQAQLPVLGARIASDGDTAFLVLLVVSGVGSLIGVLAVARLRRPPTLAVIGAGVICLGLVVVVMGMTTSYPAMLALMVVGGMLTFWVMTCANILIQHVVDDRQRGRVMSLYFLCWGGLVPFGGIGIGSLMATIGSPAAFAIFGVVAAAGGAVILARRRPADGTLRAPGHVPRDTPDPV